MVLEKKGADLSKWHRSLVSMGRCLLRFQSAFVGLLTLLMSYPSSAKVFSLQPPVAGSTFIYECSDGKKITYQIEEVSSPTEQGQVPFQFKVALYIDEQKVDSRVKKPFQAFSTTYSFFKSSDRTTRGSTPQKFDRLNFPRPGMTIKGNYYRYSDGPEYESTRVKSDMVEISIKDERKLNFNGKPCDGFFVLENSTPLDRLESTSTYTAEHCVELGLPVSYTFQERGIKASCKLVSLTLPENDKKNQSPDNKRSEANDPSNL